MTESAKRLARLHVLRCRIAEAATAERQRSAQVIGSVEQSMHVLCAEVAAQHERREDPWRERQALLELAAGQRHHLAVRREHLQQILEQSSAQEREAVQAREQVGRMLEELRAQIEAERSRREQARLDDLFATARVRAAMAMAS